MGPLAMHTETEELTDSLAGIVGYLRTGQYAGIPERLEQSLQGAGGRFRRQLEEHLRSEEEVIFPAFRIVHPAAVAELGALLEEHKHLRILASELSEAMIEGRRDEACELARLFLLDLADHAERESELFSRVTAGLDETALRRVTDLMFQRRVLGAVADMRPWFLERDAFVWVRFTGGRSVRAFFWWSREMDAPSLALRARFLEQLRERVPELDRVEVDGADGDFAEMGC